MQKEYFSLYRFPTIEEALREQQAMEELSFVYRKTNQFTEIEFEIYEVDEDFIVDIKIKNNEC